MSSKLFILIFALAVVMGGQLFGVRGGLVCKCGPYAVLVKTLECTAQECHDASEHKDQTHASKSGGHKDSEPGHHQPERLELKLSNGLPGPVALPQIFLMEAAPMTFDFGGTMDISVDALRLAQPGRWGPGTEMPLVSQPLVVAKFTVLLI